MYPRIIADVGEVFNEFLKKASEGYNLIPIIKEIESFDKEAIDIYSNHFDKKKSFFFESLEGDKNWSRYTIIGCSSGDFIEIYDNEIHRFSNFSCEEKIQHSNPIEWLEEYFNTFKAIQEPILEPTKIKLFFFTIFFIAIFTSPVHFDILPFVNLPEDFP